MVDTCFACVTCLKKRTDSKGKNHSALGFPYKSNESHTISGARLASVSNFWSAASLSPLSNILECGTPRAALIYFGLRRVPAPL